MNELERLCRDSGSNYIIKRRINECREDDPDFCVLMAFCLDRRLDSEIVDAAITRYSLCTLETKEKIISNSSLVARLLSPLLNDQKIAIRLLRGREINAAHMKQFLFHIKEDTIRKDYIQFLQELEGEEKRLLLVGVINDIARYVVEPNDRMRDYEREFLMDLLRLFPVRTAEEEELVSAAWLESFVRLMDISYINHITIMDGVYIDCDAVERIATLHQREYGRYRGVSCGVCKDTIDRIMTFFDPEGLTDEVVKRWVIESQEIIGSNGAFLLRALYVHLINEHLVSVMNYTFLLDYLKCLLEYWWRQKWDRRDGSLEGKTKALVDEAMALYRGLSLEQKNEVITNNEICKMSHDPKKEYFIAYFATGRSFSVSELTELKYTGVDDGDEDIKQILKAVMDDNFRSIIEEAYDDGKGDIRRIAETLRGLLWAADRNWRSVIKNDPEVYTMFLAYSVMKDKKTLGYRCRHSFQANVQLCIDAVAEY